MSVDSLIAYMYTVLPIFCATQRGGRLLAISSSTYLSRKGELADHGPWSFWMSSLAWSDGPIYGGRKAYIWACFLLLGWNMGFSVAYRGVVGIGRRITIPRIYVLTYELWEGSVVNVSLYNKSLKNSSFLVLS